MKTNRNGIPILDGPQTVAPVMPVEPVVPVLPARILIKHDSTIVCATGGCKHVGLYLRADGPCCPDCLYAVLVAEHRAAMRGRSYQYVGGGE
jgi:hypothetical protein